MGKLTECSLRVHLPSELQTVAWQGPHLTEHGFWLVHHMRLFVQGSYGVVKLAYNENDNTYYVSIPIPSK